MKSRIYLSVLVVLAVVSSTSAQVTFGIQAGQLHSWHSTAMSPADKNNAALKGLSFNLTVYKNLNKFIQLGIEPGIAQIGTRRDYPEFVSSAPFSSFVIIAPPFFTSNVLHSTYVQLPLMARLQVPLASDKFSFFIKGGTGIAWLASAYEEIGTFGYEGVGGDIRRVDFENYDHFRRVDFGLHGGAGLNVKIGLGQLSVGCITYYGMRQISERNDRRNRSIGYTLGYHINLK